MRSRLRFRTISIVTLAIVLVGAGMVSATANDADDDYPTWADVQSARASETATQAEYVRLESSLDRAQAEAQGAMTVAASAVTASQQAKQDLEDATEREAQLHAFAEQAQAELDENSEGLARMVSWLYMNGTGMSSTSELVTSQDPEEFMAKLSVATQVTDSWNAMAEKSAAEFENVASLNEQAEQAKQERARLADESETAAATAAAAQADAESAVAETIERTDTVYAQLASLRGTTAEAERLYQVGVRVAADQAEQSRQREQAAQSSGSGGSASGAGQVIVDPSAAQAYARSRLGAHGWSDSQFSCLVSLWNGESNWRSDALNPYSGAYGIPQSYPAEKMAAAGADWRTNGKTQVDWGLAYISAAYGSPCSAWSAWQRRSPHWY